MSKRTAAGSSAPSRKRSSGSKRHKPQSKPEKAEATRVLLSKTDSAPQLNLSKDQLGAVGDKGFRMVRATNGVREGSWYWEAEVLPPVGGEGHVRLGWAAKPGELQAPVGFDQWSYGYRDVAGSKLHKSVRDDNYGEPYGPGDVVGCAIWLNVHISQAAAAAAGSSSFTPPEQSTSNANQPPSHIRFFKNGVDQGVAFEIINRNFFPAVSLYKGGRVRVNFGPTWICPPQSGPDHPVTPGDAHSPPGSESVGSAVAETYRAIAELKPLNRQELANQALETRNKREERAVDGAAAAEAEKEADVPSPPPVSPAPAAAATAGGGGGRSSPVAADQADEAAAIAAEKAAATMTASDEFARAPMDVDLPVPESNPADESAASATAPVLKPASLR